MFLGQSSKHFGCGKHPTRWGSVAIQQVVVLCGVEVHDDAGSIQQLFVTAGTGDAVVAVPAVTSVVQLLWLHLATHRSPEQGEETEGWVQGCRGFKLNKAKLAFCWKWQHWKSWRVKTATVKRHKNQLLGKLLCKYLKYFYELLSI